MSSVPKVRTPEAITEEISKLESRGFSYTAINLILKMESKFDRFLYDSLSAKLTDEQIQIIKDKVFEEDCPIGNVNLLGSLARRGYDISKINPKLSSDAVVIEANLLKAGLEPDKYIKNDMPEKSARSILTMIENGIDLTDFKEKDFTVNGLQILAELSKGISGIGKENFKTFFKTTLSPEQFSAYFDYGLLNKNKLDLAICDDRLSVEQITVIAKFHKKYKDIDISEYLDPAIGSKQLEVLLDAKRIGIDMNEFKYSTYSKKRLAQILDLKEKNLDYSLLLSDIPDARTILIYDALIKDSGKYNVSIFADMTISEEEAKAIYFLSTKGYTVQKPCLELEK